MKGIWVFLHHQRIIYTPKRINNNASECRSSSGGFAVQAFLTTPTTTPPFSVSRHRGSICWPCSPSCDDHPRNWPIVPPNPSGLRPDFCLQPPYTGPCRAMFTRYFYNAVSGLCQTFTYGGCRKKQNNFLSEKECISTCGGGNRAQGKTRQSRVGGEAAGERGGAQGLGKGRGSGVHTPFPPAGSFLPAAARRGCSVLWNHTLSEFSKGQLSRSSPLESPSS